MMIFLLSFSQTNKKLSYHIYHTIDTTFYKSTMKIYFHDSIILPNIKNKLTAMSIYNYDTIVIKNSITYKNDYQHKYVNGEENLESFLNFYIQLSYGYYISLSRKYNQLDDINNTQFMIFSDNDNNLIICVFCKHMNHDIFMHYNWDNKNDTPTTHYVYDDINDNKFTSINDGKDYSFKLDK